MLPRQRKATFGADLHERAVHRAIHRIKKCQHTRLRERRIDEFVAAVLARSAARHR